MCLFWALARRHTSGYSWSTREEKMQEQELIEKIRQLPRDKQTEVEDFVEFLKHRDEDLRLTQAAARLSEEAFRQVWDNEADSAYDKL
jgi:hypothetical protein